MPGRTRCSAECAKRDILMPFLSWRDRVDSGTERRGRLRYEGGAHCRAAPWRTRWEGRGPERGNDSFPEFQAPPEAMATGIGPSC
ncbi:hypothetical protein GCM10010345_80450 [Streptomyces canarius]|uniref:Uncharacterized protein n=1 Tax=Streptomyces canarius TaxID=285453 RepID=A0ABQ3D8P4_9ACTN|nr:hypothetical protein GCM10010345_80450 [Streptomyces canarius]